jgi:hypothetical protein
VAIAARPLLTLLSVVALPGSACNDAGPPPVAGGTVLPTATAPASTATAAQAPSAAGTVATPQRRPGVPAAINTIINLVLAGDAAAVEQATSLVSLPCGPQQGPGSPPACRPGEANGTRVDVFPVATCQGELRPAAAVRPTLEQIVLAKPALVGVYRAPSPYLAPVQGDYVVVFSRTPTAAVTTPLGAGLVIAGDRIAGAWFGCGARPHEIVPAGTEPVFLPGS